MPNIPRDGCIYGQLIRSQDDSLLVHCERFIRPGTRLSAPGADLGSYVRKLMLDIEVSEGKTHPIIDDFVREVIARSLR